MKQYDKIQTIYFRDPEYNFKYLLEGTWSKTEFQLLKDIDWIWTEKIDGTNIRVMWDGENVRFGGKTDNAQIPTILLPFLQDTFTPDKMLAAFPESNEVCLYGEGYGKKIQKGGNYLADTAKFIIFDVRIDGWWLQLESVVDVATNLEIDIVPIIGIGPLERAVEYVREGFVSEISENREYLAEGLVLRPPVDLFNRKGERIITKIKYNDFKKD